MTKTKNRPLTEAEQELIADHWYMVLGCIEKLIMAKRIKPQDRELAKSFAGRIAINAAKSHVKARSQFSTYLWIPIMRLLPTKVNEFRAQNKDSLTANDANSLRDALSVKPGQRRRLIREDRSNVRTGNITQGIPDRKLGPWREAESDEGVVRLQNLLDECEAELPEPGRLLKRSVEGASHGELAKETGTTASAVGYRIETARKWMAWKLYGKAS